MSTEDMYSFTKIKKVLNSIYKGIETNKSSLSKMIKIDEEDGYSFDFEFLKTIVKKYLNYKEVLTEEDIKSQKLDGIGNIAVVYDGRPETTIEMIIKCLLTNNEITLYPNLDFATTKCILKIFEESLKEVGYKNKAINCIYESEDIYDNQDNYDVAVLIGDKYQYARFKQRFKKDIIYYEFGAIQLYCDNDYFDDEIDKIRTFAFENNYSIDYYDDENIEDAVKDINDVTVTDRVAIFTKDSKKALELLKNIKANKIYINTNPFENYSFEFDEKKLLLKKEIITG